MSDPQKLEVTWTRYAQLVEVVSWNTLRVKIDVGFHCWRRVAANITEGWFQSPSESEDFVRKWFEGHDSLIVRTRKVAEPRGLVVAYVVQVQGRNLQTGERDDLLYDLTRAMRPHAKKQPEKPATLEVDWIFPADMIRLVDGDTQEFEVDAGFHTDRRITDRLLGVNCPETKGASRPAGLAASDFSRQWYEGHDEIIIQTRPDPKHWTDSFRRYLVRVQGRNLTTGAREDLAQSLLAAKHAVPFMEEQSK